MELSSPSNPDVDASGKPSRRKSGRVVPPRQIYSPSGSTKRKRGDGADSGEESSDDAEDSEEEPHEEDTRPRERSTKKTSTNKSFHKRAKTNGVTTQLAMRPAAKSKAKKPRQGQTNKAEVGDAVGLYGKSCLEVL